MDLACSDSDQLRPFETVMSSNPALFGRFKSSLNDLFTYLFVYLFIYLIVTNKKVIIVTCKGCRPHICMALYRLQIDSRYLKYRTTGIIDIKKTAVHAHGLKRFKMITIGSTKEVFIKRKALKF